MSNVVLRSGQSAETVIKDTIEFLEEDLHIITGEGATVRTNKFLISRGSLILRTLLNHEISPSLLLLPDLTGPALLHFISIIEKGFSYGQGQRAKILKEVREVAQVLGFENISELSFEADVNLLQPDGEDLHQTAPEKSNETVMGVSGDKNDEVLFVDIKIELEESEGSNAAVMGIGGGENEDVSLDLVNMDIDIKCEPEDSLCEQNGENNENPETSNNNESDFTNAEDNQYDQNLLNYARGKLCKGPRWSKIETKKVKITNYESDVQVHNAETLLVHDEKHGKTIGNRKCPMCNYSGARMKLLNHIRLNHTQEKLFQCSICPKKFFSYGAKSLHERTAHVSNSYNQSSNDDRSINTSSINDNSATRNRFKEFVEITYHDVDVQVTDVQVTEAITKVLKKEPNEANDNEHIREVLPQHQCVRCKKTFSNAATLLVHAEKHGGILCTRKCPMCNYAVYARVQLLAHIRAKHTQEKLFECSFCLEKFTTFSVKNNHEKKHINYCEEMTYVRCDQNSNNAGSTNTYLSDEIKHETTRNSPLKGKLFQCTLCSKIFSSLNYKDQHEKIHFFST